MHWLRYGFLQTFILSFILDFRASMTTAQLSQWGCFQEASVDKWLFSSELYNAQEEMLLKSCGLKGSPLVGKFHINLVYQLFSVCHLGSSFLVRYNKHLSSIPFVLQLNEKFWASFQHFLLVIALPRIRFSSKGGLSCPNFEYLFL